MTTLLVVLIFILFFFVQNVCFVYLFALKEEGGRGEIYEK